MVGGLDDLARGPDQQVGIPDRRHAVLGQAMHFDPDPARLVEDRRSAPSLGEAEEGLAHQVALVARADAVVRDRDERVEPCPLGAGEPVRHHGAARFAGNTLSLPGSEVEVRRPLSTQRCNSSTR